MAPRKLILVPCNALADHEIGSLYNYQGSPFQADPFSQGLYPDGPYTGPQYVNALPWSGMFDSQGMVWNLKTVLLKS
jgi:hypothetical protein